MAGIVLGKKWIDFLCKSGNILPMTDTSYIYLWEGRFLYAGKSISSHTHSNHALEIGISMDKPFRMKDAEGIWKESHGIMIAPDSNHECMAPAASQIIHIGLEPESMDANKIIKIFLNKSHFAFLDGHNVVRFANQFKQQLTDYNDISSVSRILNNFLGQLMDNTSSWAETEKHMDARIKNVIRLLKESNEDRLSLRELADRAGLSDSRLVHLFKEQVGIPIRRYALWIRLNRAILEIARTRNLTEAAHNAGFADSAHFSRTFLRMFGSSPSEILKNSQIIQALPVYV
jgi:AraC-like DNA-binding protein